MAIRKTKIICTIGPAVESEEKIKALISAGMDAARFNFSHGSHEEHKARIDLLTYSHGQGAWAFPTVNL